MEGRGCLVRCSLYTGMMIRYAISAGDAREFDHGALLEDARRWAAAGIGFVQLREKQLKAAELVALAASMVEVFARYGSRTRLLINSHASRADVAVAARADGVHLTSKPGELTPAQVRQIFAYAGLPRAIVSVSCHTLDEVRRAGEAGADLILFGPVFEKRVGGDVVSPGVGLDALRQACEAAIGTPVLALGGITADKISDCEAAGAAGVAAIRLFQ